MNASTLFCLARYLIARMKALSVPKNCEIFQ